MNWRDVLLLLGVTLALGAAFRAGGISAESGAPSVVKAPVVRHVTEATPIHQEYALSGHEKAAVCRTLVRAGVLVSCTYGGGQ